LNNLGIMEQEQNTAQAPDLSNEEMKMPENMGTHPIQKAPSNTPVNGIIIAVLAVLLIAILGGMYYWFSQLTEQATSMATPEIERPTAEENNEPESTTAEAAVETQQAMSTSDEISAIEADIAATNLNELDAELNAIDAELNAAIEEEI
jgi:flagellar basal body-associated protein FliL